MSEQTKSCPHCGDEIIYSGRGRRPVFCSETCRHRAWELRRARAQILSENPELNAPAELTTPRVVGWLRKDETRIGEVVDALCRTTETRATLVRALAEQLDDDNDPSPVLIARPQKRKDHHGYIKQAQKNAGSKPASKRHTTR